MPMKPDEIKKIAADRRKARMMSMPEQEAKEGESEGEKENEAPMGNGYPAGGEARVSVTVCIPTGKK